jgi:flagellar basal-body rod modification protein FlgD
MAVDAIGMTATAENALPRNAAIRQEDFMQILLSQLRFQDPLKPVDNQQFVAQLAQFSSLEINRQQSEKVDALLQMNSASQALALLGRRVDVGGVNGGSAGVGEVFAVSFASGEPRLSVRVANGQPLVDVQLSRVQLVQEET